MGQYERAFEPFYQAHRAAVFRTAYLITAEREEARDLTQETVVRAFEHWEEVSTHERPAAWLQTVVGRLSISWRRRQAVRRKAALRRGRSREVEVTDPTESAEPAVIQALQGLTPAQRTVLVLRFYADRSVEDVARTLGKRPGTVKALTAQGLERLRPVLDAKGVRL